MSENPLKPTECVSCPQPIADFPIDRPVPVFVPPFGWVIGTVLGVGWDEASKKHVAASIITTEGTIVNPTHFLPVILPLPLEPKD